MLRTMPGPVLRCFRKCKIDFHLSVLPLENLNAFHCISKLEDDYMLIVYHEHQHVFDTTNGMQFDNEHFRE